jgi:DNA-binding response OmpR family regulator
MTQQYCLVVDDDEIARSFLSDWLRSHDYAVESVATLAAAEVRLQSGRFEYLISDRRLPDGDGLAWLREQWRRGDGPRASRCLLTTGDDLNQMVLPPELCFLRKPLDLDAVLRWIRTSRTAQTATTQEGAPQLAATLASIALLEDASALARMGGRAESLAKLREMLRIELTGGGLWQSRLSDPDSRLASISHLHRLRAACALTGCLRLALHSEAIEAALREDRAVVSAELAAFQDCVAATVNVLTQARALASD